LPILILARVAGRFQETTEHDAKDPACRKIEEVVIAQEKGTKNQQQVDRHEGPIQPRRRPQGTLSQGGSCNVETRERDEVSEPSQRASAEQLSSS
jgi:hypothetical protein